MVGLILFTYNYSAAGTSPEMNCSGRGTYLSFAVYSYTPIVAFEGSPLAANSTGPDTPS